MRTVNDELRSFVMGSMICDHGSAFLADDSSFIESGVIDSTGVLELINYIETRFRIKVEDHELAPENLDSINGLIRFIQKKRHPAPTTFRAGA